jgi:hypothetical protein
VPGLKLKAGDKVGAEVEFRFERSRSSRRILAEELEALSSDAVRAVEELVERVTADLINTGYHGLVLLAGCGNRS